MTERSSPDSEAPVPLADHDEIGRKVLRQPWSVQSAIVTIAAHCRVLVDKHPTGDVADLAGCISQDLMELADALSAPAQAAPEPAAWQWRYVGRDEPWATPSGGERLTAEVLKREPPIVQRPLYAAAPQEAQCAHCGRHLECPECVSLSRPVPSCPHGFHSDTCVDCNSFSRPLRQVTDGDGE